MKIVEVINSLDKRGGAEVFFSSLNAELSKNDDVELYVVCLYSNLHESFNFLIKNENIKFYTINKHNSFDITAAFKFKKILKNIEPDIVNIHLSCLPTYYLAFKNKKTKWKLVKTFHSIPGIDCNKFSLIIEKKYAKKKLLSFIGISDKITQKAKLIYKTSNIKTIYNGINLSPIICTHNKKFDFCIVANLEPVKNHILLLKAIKELNKKEDINLLIVGDGSQRKKLENYVQENSLERNILFVGKVSNVYDYLRDSKYFVLSSLVEGNPISILEAMNCGLPIIAPNVGGIPDIITNKENGILYEKNDLNSLINALDEIRSMDYKKISFVNCERVKEFDIKCTANSYIAFFKEIL